MAALTVTVASVTKSTSGQIATGTAGATITQGQPVYIDTANSNVIKPANANAGDAVAATVAGVALNAALTGQPVTYLQQDDAYAHGFDTGVVNAGDPIYLDDTAGGMTKTFADLDSGDYLVLLGVINATETTMQLRPFTKVVKA